MYEVWEFQSLIGTGKTQPNGKAVVAPDEVSIPHRYGQDIAANPPEHAEQMFQSLIGTGKTYLSLYDVRAELVFQSLIGTGKTLFEKIVAYAAEKFQSLIGTGKTNNQAHERIWAHSAVSIPHRYGQDTYQVWLGVLREGSFNPS